MSPEAPSPDRDHPADDPTGSPSGVTVASDPDGETRSGGTVRGRRFLLIAISSLLAIGVAWRLWPAGEPDPREGTVLVDDQGMAERHGIRVTQIGVSAAGGIIDFRYQVVDPDKATPLVHEEELLPVLISEETGMAVGMGTPPHHHANELELGGTYFFLMANGGNAIRKGDHVTVVIGDARVENIIAQG